MSIVAVAKRAGVSRTTVSRVLSGARSVQARTAKQVRRAMKELGYKPVRSQLPKVVSADCLEQLRGGAFAIFAVGDVGTLLSRPEVQVAVSGMKDAAQELGIELRTQRAGITRGTRNPTRHATRGGIVFVELGQPESRVHRLASQIPLIRVLSPAPPRIRIDDISSDPAAIGQMAFDHLRDRGCSTLLFVTDDPGYLGTQLNAGAFAEAAHRSGRRTQGIMIGAHRPAVSSLPGECRVVRSVSAFIEKLDLSTATGLLVPGVDLATQLLTNLKELRPDEHRKLTLVTFDGDPDKISQLDPAVPCIDLQWKLAGRLAVQQLVHRLLNPTSPVVRVQVPAVWRHRRT
jgi:DNA-binding LacI/PurR family transcriptional regulator